MHSAHVFFLSLGDPDYEIMNGKRLISLVDFVTIEWLPVIYLPVGCKMG